MVRFCRYNRSHFTWSLFAIAFIIFSGSCVVRSVYVPATQNTPLFDSGRQIKGNGYLSVNHIEMQGAVNISRHLALATNINFGSGISIYDLALGLYSHNKNSTVRYELFGGYSLNSNVNTSTSVLSYFSTEKMNFQVNAQYNRLYIQPAIGYFNQMNIFGIKYAFILSNRVSYIAFNDYLYREIDATKTTDPNNPYYIVNKEYRNKKLFLFEPAITNKVGKKNFYGIAQLQAIIPYSSELDVRNTKFSPGIVFSAGIEFDFGMGKRK